MKQLRIHYLQHVSFEGLGYIETWALENNHILTSTKFYERHQLPNSDEFDWLVIMGGPMGVYDEEKYDCMSYEKEFIRQAIKKSKTVIGVCLGAQLIANVLGAKVYPNDKKEIGWFPMSLTDSNHSITDTLPSKFDVLHWHGDTFELPKGAIHLMQTDVCKNQGFIYKNKVVGLQFHLEAIPDTLTGMIENCRHELIKDDYVQTEKEISNQISSCNQTNVFLKKILDQLSKIR